MLQIKKKTRQALGLFSWAILFYDAWDNFSAFGLTKLHLGSTTGSENYLYTAGDSIWPEGDIDSGGRRSGCSGAFLVVSAERASDLKPAICA